MRVIIVEDEPVIARRLARLLSEIGGGVGPIEIVSDLAAAGALAAAQRDGLVFLDLNLHGRDGFELLRQGLANGWRTVVVSAHAERAIEAFELGVVDFVPKPFTRERLALALSRAAASAPDERLRYLAALQGSGTTLVRLDEIVAIHGADDYSEIEVADGRRFLHRKSLQRLGGELPPPFVRVHRSHIVNLDRALGLDRTDGGAWQLRLEDGRWLPVGRRALGELRKRFV